MYSDYEYELGIINYMFSNKFKESFENIIDLMYKALESGGSIESIQEYILKYDSIKTIEKEIKFDTWCQNHVDELYEAWLIDNEVDYREIYKQWLKENKESEGF